MPAGFDRQTLARSDAILKGGKVDIAVQTSSPTCIATTRCTDFGRPFVSTVTGARWSRDHLAARRAGLRHGAQQLSQQPRPDLTATARQVAAWAPRRTASATALAEVR